MFFSRQFKLFLFLLVLLPTVANSVLAANIIVRVDRNPVNLKESFQISFTIDGDADGDPDFSPLDKDFEVINQSQQQSVQIANWNKTKSLQWILTVKAKREGSLVIPAINFGQDTSQFSSVMVLKTQVSNATSGDLFLQVEVDTKKPYVQEQLIYTLKLFRKVNISQASLTEPELKDAVIEKLGEDKNYNTQFKGENYVVTERKYAIFPQKSGTMSIAPLTLVAEIVMPSQRRTNSFFNRQRTRTKRVASAPIQLEVQAKPANTGAAWLPAKQVILQEQWTENSAQVTVGQPITRTLRLTVVGQTASALPVLYHNNMPGHLKAYPDQPVLQDNARNTGMVAVREEKIALIPAQAGRFKLPAIEIPWWNTGTQTMEVVRIAERTIIAVVAPGMSEPSESQDIPLMPTPIISTQVETEPEKIWNSIQLWFGLALFFALGWAATLVYFLTKNTSKAKLGSAAKPEKELLIVKPLKKACANNDPVLAKNALLQWGRKQFSQSSLTKIAAHCEPSLQQQILMLNDVLYSHNAGAWEGHDLLVAFENTHTAKKAKNMAIDPLQPLFKI